ncbi:MAG TPA: SMC-Scp complex subunit ScpB [Gammaproteobacteria bacterium]|nr:SMC-Scp complex subunit ScpB [Gammaproteobacteria bacterium]
MMTLDTQPLRNIVEAALLAAGRPMSLDELLALFTDAEQPERTQLREALETLRADYAERGIELVEVASGFRVQVRKTLAPWISRLWEERPARYSRALLETLALIAYRQPITRGEIEDVRGVAVSTHIMKTLQDRNWIRLVGHRDVPGHPAMFGTTREFLDYFSLKSLDELPTLAALKDIDSLNVELDLGDDNPLRQVVDDGDDGMERTDDAGDETSLHAEGEAGEPVGEPPQP